MSPVVVWRRGGVRCSLLACFGAGGVAKRQAVWECGLGYRRSAGGRINRSDATMFGPAHGSGLLAPSEMLSTIARRDCDMQGPPTVSDW